MEIKITTIKNNTENEEIIAYGNSKFEIGDVIYRVIKKRKNKFILKKDRIYSLGITRYKEELLIGFRLFNNDIVYEDVDALFKECDKEKAIDYCIKKNARGSIKVVNEDGFSSF